MGIHVQGYTVIFLLIFLFFLCLLSSCGEFIGFSPLPQLSLPDITRVDFRLSDNGLQRLYEGVLENTTVPFIYEVNNTQTDAYIKIMGSFSRLFPKKNYSVSFKNSSLRYAFEAAYDYFITNRIALSAYSRAGLFAPDTGGTALYINNTYIGCYTRIPMYNEQELYNHYNKKSGELFKAHFLEMGNDIPLHYRTEKKFPDDNDFTSVNTFVYNAKNIDDTAWSEWVDTYIDKEEVIRYLAVQTFLKVKDTARFNFYIYNYGKMLFLPWDNEMSMDLSSEFPLDGNNLLAKRLLEEPSIRAGYNETMRCLFLTGEGDIQPFLDHIHPESTENIIDDLLGEVNNITSEIDRAIYYEPTFYFAYQDYIDEVNSVIAFLNIRSSQIPDPVLP